MPMRSRWTNPVGLKVWSINLDYRDSIARIIAADACDYIELYTVPGTPVADLDFWRQFSIPYIIHAPTTQHDLNPAIPDRLKDNLALFEESRSFFDALQAEYLIVHPGMGGSMEAATEFLSRVAFDKILVENKPFRSLDDRICIGCTPEQIDRLMKECGIGFCLDFGHAVKAAYSLNRSAWDILEEFNRLNPRVYHLSDGWMNSEMDEHLNLGEGDFDIPRLVHLLNPTMGLTLETSKPGPDFADQFIKESGGVRALMPKRRVE